MATTKKGKTCEAPAKETAQAQESRVTEEAPAKGLSESQEQARPGGGSSSVGEIQPGPQSDGTFGSPLPGIDDFHAPVVTKLPAVRAKLEPTPEIVERASEAREALESFQGITLPIVRFKEDFELVEGEDHVDDFDGVMLYTKESNVFYQDRFKMGSRQMPTCFSPDGKTPSVAMPQSPTCATCPHNQFGSAKEGEGKACKNTRPVFIAIRLTDGSFGVIPKVLRVPPTSLTLIKNYVVATAADFGSYYGVVTKFRAYKRSDDQTHYNIGFNVAERLTAQDKADVAYLRSVWLPVMSSGNFGVEEEELRGPPPPSTADYSKEAF